MALLILALLHMIFLMSSLMLLLSFPTRRSSDLKPCMTWGAGWRIRARASRRRPSPPSPPPPRDRKSTRLNSSHITISYAVFCSKKKKNHHHGTHSAARYGVIPQLEGRGCSRLHF